MSFVSTTYNYYRFLITKVKDTGSSPVINEIVVRDTSNNYITNLTISGSSTNDVSNNGVDKLIDGSGSTFWTCLSGRYTNGIPNSTAAITYTNIRRNLSGEWFQIYSPTAFDLKDIIIRSSVGTNSQPDNIIVLGSISGGTLSGDLWSIHHIFTNITYRENVSVNNIYDVKPYSYYRFIGARLANKRALVQYHELQLFGSEKDKTTNVEYPPINLSGGQTSQFNIPQYNISGQDYGNGIYNLSASTVGYNLYPTNAFDGTGLSYSSAESLNSYSDIIDAEGGSWPGGTTVTTVSQMTISGQWCQIQLPEPITLNVFNYFFNGNGSPSSFVIAGSNNGTTWDLVRFYNKLVYSSSITYSLRVTSPLPTAVDSFKSYFIDISSLDNITHNEIVNIKYVNDNTQILAGYSSVNIGIYDLSNNLSFTISGLGSYGYSIIYKNGIPQFALLQDNFTNLQSDYTTSICVDVSNIYIIGYGLQDSMSFSTLDGSGQLVSRTTYDISYLDVFVTKYDFSGNLKWVTRIGGSGGQRSISIATFGGKIYVGTYTSFESATNPYLTNIYDPSNNIILTASGITTYGLIVQFDENGKPVWRVYSSGACYEIQIKTDGLYVYVVGTTTSNVKFYSSNDVEFNYNMSGAHVFIMCLNTDGIIQWITKVSTQANNSLAISSIAVYNNRLYIGGHNYNSILNLYSASNSNTFTTYYKPNVSNTTYGVLIGYTTSGEPLWAIETEDNSYGSTIGDIKATGNGIYCTATYRNSINIYDTSQNIIKTHSISGLNSAIIKFDLSGRYIHSYTSKSGNISTGDTDHYNKLDVYNNKLLHSVHSLSGGAYYNTYDISQVSFNTKGIYIVENRDISATLTVPTTPTINVSSSVYNTITLSWSSITNISGYRLYYGINNYTNIIDISSNLTSYTLNLETSGVKYYIVLTSLNSYGESIPSNLITRDTFLLPSQPTIISAVGDKKKATLTIQRAQGATTHFLKYKKTSSQNFTTIQIE